MLRAVRQGLDQTIGRYGGKRMEYRQFGKTDLKISAIGFGYWEIGGTYGRIDESEFRRAVTQAIDSGITCFERPRLTAWACPRRRSRERLVHAETRWCWRPNLASAMTKCRTAETAAGCASSPRSRRACNGSRPIVSTSISCIGPIP